MWAMLAAMALSGCAVGPHFSGGSAPGAERYTAEQLQLETAPGNAAGQRIAYGQKPPTDWWTLLASDDLDRVVNAALAGNRTLAAAEATLSRARELAAAETGALFPEVSLSANVGRQ
jgi:outer membrane protein TolC